MIMYREDILEALASGHLILSMYDADDPEWQQRIQPASIDLRVGGATARFRNDPGVVHQRMPRRLTQIDESLYQREYLAYGQTFLIQPQEFLLVDVDVEIALPSDIAAFIEGKSTVGRSGLFVVNAGFVEPGFRGTLVLECLNAAPFPIEVASGDDICHIVLFKGERATAFPYGTRGLGSRYQDQTRAQPPVQRGMAAGGYR